MTQDPYGPGDVARGEVVPDHEGNVTPPTAPMTQFQKVASALRGDRTDPTMAVHVPPDAAPSDAAPSDAAPSDAAPSDAAPSDAAPSDAAPSDAATATSQDTLGDTTHPEEIVAVRSPDAGADVAAQDPRLTQPDLYGATARAVTDASRADTATAGAGEPDGVGEHAPAPAQEGSRPGESGHELGDFSDLTYGSLLPDAAEFKAHWQQVQFRFVDDPPGSVTEAADVVAQVTAKLEAAIAERQRAIAERQRALRARWSEGKSTDTESLRETLLMYRAFLHQLTGPKDG
jgi:hypothetical protein